MKKVLFATTALIATAGMAAAEVTFGGYGRFGIRYVEATSSTDITSRFRLQIDATAESDSGVTFGARARIQQDNDGAATTAARLGADGVAGTADDANFNDSREETGINGVRFFARTGGLEVGVGNIFGAISSMPGQYPIDLGLTGLSYAYTAAAVGGGYFDEYNSDGNGAAGSNGVEVMYSVGDFGMHVSASDTNDRVAAHFAYTFSGWTVALGLQDSTNAADVETTVSVGGTLGVANVSLAYAENGNNADRIVLAGLFDVGAATTIEAYAADDSTNGSSFGLGVNHDLGGGTSIQAGYDDNFGNALVDLGVRFNF